MSILKIFCGVTAVLVISLATGYYVYNWHLAEDFPTARPASPVPPQHHLTDEIEGEEQAKKETDDAVSIVSQQQVEKDNQEEEKVSMIEEGVEFNSAAVEDAEYVQVQQGLNQAFESWVLQK